MLAMVPQMMVAATNDRPKRLLILASKLGYQTHSFAEAAQTLGVETIFGTDRRSEERRVGKECRL